MFNRHLRSLISLFLIILISNCSRPLPPYHAQGYIEGRYTYMATNVSGILKEILVQRGTRVKRGQKLYSLDKQPESDAYQAAIYNLNQAIAARDVTLANLAYAKITYERNKILVPKNAITQSQLDSALATFEATKAQLIQGEANIISQKAALAQAKWELDQKIAYAPIDAMVFDTYYRLGEYTVATKAVLSLLAPADIKAIFYVREPDLAMIKLGDKVTVQCDRCKKNYVGKVSFISPTAEYTPPLIYSIETNAKLIFRIEAEFSPEDAYQLHPGQPVFVNYNPHDK